MPSHEGYRPSWLYEFPPDYEEIKDMIVWRCVSSRTFSGGMSGFPHQEFLYSDYVLTPGLGKYLAEIDSRGNVDKITLHRMGRYADVLGSVRKQHPGTKSIVKEGNIKKLEAWE